MTNMKEKTRKRRKMIKRAFRIALYIIAVFLFQELVVRICFPVPEIANFDRANYLTLTQDGTSVQHTRDLTLSWQSSPDTTAIFSHYMNRYGFRDKPWKLKKPKGKKRIVFIGDSFVEGVMAAQGQTIPVGFDQASGEAYEVWNAGLVGKGLNAYLQLTADMVPLFKPDVVFLCIYANDLGEKAPYIPPYYLEPTFFNFFTPRLIDFFREKKRRGSLRFRWHTQCIPYFSSVPDPGNPWSTKEGTLAPQVRPSLAKAMREGTFNPFLVNKLAKEEKHLKASPKLGDALPFFSDFCRRFHASPVIVYLPSRNQLTNYYLPFEQQYCLNQCPDSIELTAPAYHLHRQVIAAQCKQLNVPFIDLTPTLKKIETQGERLYWNFDQHMKRKGYMLAGKTIWEKWKQLPTSPP